MSRLKKLNRIDIYDRDKENGAIVYINGELFEGYTHAECIDEYLSSNNKQNLTDNYGRPWLYEPFKNYQPSQNDIKDEEILKENVKQLAFAHKCSDDMYIHVEESTLQNVDINTVCKEIKKSYPDYSILIEETSEKIAKKNNKKITRLAAYISSDFDSFTTPSGDIIAISCRLVNNGPWYQVYQEGLYNISSFYDGPEYSTAHQMYTDLLTAFKGVNSTEKYNKSLNKVKDNIESLIDEEKNDTYNFQRLKSDPLFLGVNNFGF